MAETIVDRVVARLKASQIGELITEADLQSLVAEAIPRTFFEPRKYLEGYREVTKPPLLSEVLEGLLKSQVEKSVNQWLQEHPEEVTKYWAKVCDAGLLEYVQKVQSKLATEQIRTAMNAWIDYLNLDRNRQNLPPLSGLW